MTSTANKLLKQKIGDYAPYLGAIHFNPAADLARIPPFNIEWVPAMMENSRVKLTMEFIKGPIVCNAAFELVSRKEGVELPSKIFNFIASQLHRFWIRDAYVALRSAEWGFSAQEVLYEDVDGIINYDTIIPIHARDSTLVTKKGKPVGMRVERVSSEYADADPDDIPPEAVEKIYMGGPKFLWHVHQPQINPYFGDSQLRHAFSPWLELESRDGARQKRKLYYRKFAFTGEKGYYPLGTSPGDWVDGGPGQALADSNRDKMRQMLVMRQSGASTFMPNARDQNGNREWEIEESQAGQASLDILDYHRILRAEMTEGMGVPNEVIEAASVGSGWSGRQVPLTGYFSTLQAISNSLAFTFNRQVIKPLLHVNFGPNVPEYELLPKKLVDEPQQFQQDGSPDQSGEGPQRVPKDFIANRDERIVRLRAVAGTGAGGQSVHGQV